MSASARYEVHIPTADLLGQPLSRQLPMAAHQWLWQSKPRTFSSVWITGPHQHSPTVAHHHLVALAEESPETDSYVKQLAAHIGELANVPHVSASKHGKKGVETWHIPNRRYQDGVGASPDALENSI